MTRRSRLFFTLIWLIAVLLGTGMLLVYDYTPGKEERKVPKQWKAFSSISRTSDRPTLVMFAHPKCPCTRASLGELALLMARCQGLVNAQVVFFRPEGTAEGWTHTDLWRSAEAIPGVAVRSDQGGQEAQRFQVTTSGHVVLYGAQGQLLFDGGITAARGHSGDNPGRAAILGLLNHRLASEHKTPAFGCSLLNPASQSFGKELSCIP